MDIGNLTAFETQLSEIETFMTDNPPRNPSHRENTNILLAEYLLLDKQNAKAKTMLIQAMDFHRNDFGPSSKMYLRASKLLESITD